MAFMSNLSEENKICNLFKKRKTHSSIKKMKQNFSVKTKFSFKPITMDEFKKVIENIPKDKAVRGGDVCLLIYFKRVRFYLRQTTELY